MANRIARLIQTVDTLPRPLRPRALSLVLGQVVKFVGTARLDFEELTSARVIVSVRNRRRVQNHIGSVHGAALALLAETASGFVVGVNLPDDRVAVIKTLKVDYRKRYQGRLRATAELTPQQIEAVRTQDKGEVDVKVTVVDEKGTEPVACQMIWAWTPKRHG
jgi:uncharacterized protein (TIGR00369 family)